MRKDNLIVADKEYLLAERLSEAYMNKMLDAAKEYLNVISKLVEDGVNDDEIKCELLHLCDPLLRLLQSYGSELSFIDKKMQNYLSRIDEVDKFIY